MTFFGRTRELRTLSKFFHSNDNLAVVYGRRRIGKSELIKRALQESKIPSLYHECKGTSVERNMEDLLRMANVELGLSGYDMKTLESVLRWLFEQAADRDMVLVLDEYPYLRDLLKGCDSVLQAMLDHYRDSSRLKIILCGSYIDVMKGLIDYKSPLYGRTSVMLHLKPMDYLDAANFYPGFSNADKVRLYSVFGGVPFYIKNIDPSLSVEENILELIVDEDARLRTEIEIRQPSEISKINNAIRVFEAMTLGAAKFSDILAESHVSSSPTLADTLNKLIEMGLITKQTPINEEGNKRRTFYSIADNLTNFYYRFVFRNLSMTRIIMSNIFYDRFIREEFETQYVPHIFESICCEFLIRRNLLGLNKQPFFKIGKYYYDLPKERRNGEFDVVTFDDLGYISYEAKFKIHPMSKAQIEQEIAQVQASPLLANRFGFISRSGFEGVTPRENLMLFTLDDLYRDELRFR